MIDELIKQEAINLDKQIYMIESSLSAIKKNVYKEEVHNGRGKNFFDYHMREIYWRLTLIQKIIDKNIKEVDSNGTI